jgi:hypothetical protein
MISAGLSLNLLAVLAVLAVQVLLVLVVTVVNHMHNWKPTIFHVELGLLV